MQAASIHLANVVGAAFAGSLYFYLFFSIRKKVRQNKHRDRDRQHCFRQIDVAKGQQTKAHSLIHTHTHTLYVHCYHIYRTWSFTEPHKTKQKLLICHCPWVLFKWSLWICPFQSVFPSLLYVIVDGMKKIELDKRYYDIV